MTGTRIDKWLWAARFFKTRALASKACDLNRILSNAQPAKSSREVKVGDTLQITAADHTFTIEVLALSENRGPAPEAQRLYRETEASKQLRAQAAEHRKQNPDFFPTALPAGRPSKRDRRLIHRFRND